MALESPHCYRLYLTHIHADIDCDTFFPEYDSNQFKEVLYVLEKIFTCTALLCNYLIVINLTFGITHLLYFYVYFDIISG